MTVINIDLCHVGNGRPSWELWAVIIVVLVTNSQKVDASANHQQRLFLTSWITQWMLLRTLHCTVMETSLMDYCPTVAGILNVFVQEPRCDFFPPSFLQAQCPAPSGVCLWLSMWLWSGGSAFSHFSFTSLRGNQSCLVCCICVIIAFLLICFYKTCTIKSLQGDDCPGWHDHKQLWWRKIILL